jgi:hypothetical protein
MFDQPVKWTRNAVAHRTAAKTRWLHKKGMIGDPVNKSKSLILTEEGLERSEALFRELFTRPPQ